MAEALKYVSPQYQETLDRLAERLVLGRQFAPVALAETVELEEITIPENVILGAE